jgi:uncharacterized Zn finger protein (UPF0148 family)
MYSSHADPKIDYYRWQVAPAAPHSRGGLREAASHSHRPAGPCLPFCAKGGGGYRHQTCSVRGLPMEWAPGQTLMGARLNPGANATAAGLPPMMSEDDAYAEMSKRLLAGWTMLNEHCPISGFPLLQKGDVIWSVRCQMEVRAGAGPPTPPGALGPPEHPSTTAPASPGGPFPSEPLDIAPAPAPLAERLRNGHVAHLSESAHPPPLSSSSSSAPPPAQGSGDLSDDDISSELGQLLLQGWRMLDEQCPSGRCPLMQARGSERRYSVALGKYTDELQPPTTDQATAGRGSAASQAAAQQPVEGSGQGDPAQAHGLGTTSLSSDQISANLGQLLLQGWTMLEEECPVTGACPLMQERQSTRKYSVALGKYLDELETEKSAAPAPTKADVLVDEAGEEPTVTDDEEAAAAFEQYREQRLSEQASQAAAATAVAADDSRKGSAASATSPLMARAREALLMQIGQAEAKLRTLQPVEDAIALAQVTPLHSAHIGASWQ